MTAASRATWHNKTRLLIGLRPGLQGGIESARLNLVRRRSGLCHGVGHGLYGCLAASIEKKTLGRWLPAADEIDTWLVGDQRHLVRVWKIHSRGALSGARSAPTFLRPRG